MRLTNLLALINILILLFAPIKADSQSYSHPEILAEGTIKELVPVYSSQDVIDRLRSIPNNLVAHDYNSIVQSYVRTYTVRNRKRTEQMLGRTSMYFPIFERLLAEAGLPDELKYLSIVESALNPMARSRSGAVGLWQFMPATGKEYGLRIRSTMDERKDPEKATKAALTYLSRLYDRFGSWELALAAYNGGPGRISRAVKRAGSKNFGKISRYLPKETRHYVSAYVGASYIAHFYDAHNLTPQYPAEELINTSSVRITNGISFAEIQQRTGLPLKWIKELNPQFTKNLIPPNSRGYSLNLPVMDAELMRNSLTSLPQRNFWLEKWDANPEFQKHNYIVQNGDSVEKIAMDFKCSVLDIAKWNRLTSQTLFSGKRLTVFSKKVVRPVRNWTSIPNISNKEINSLSVLNPEELELPENNTSFEISTRRKNPRVIKQGKDKFYILARGESLSDVARKFSGVTLSDLLKANDIKINDELNPGAKLKIAR